MVSLELYTPDHDQRNKLSILNTDYEGLSDVAMNMLQKEADAPVEVTVDDSIRIKILDQCGMACTFCHNEGTPVSADNRNRKIGEFVSAGASDRVSIFLSSNGADFVSGMVEVDNAFTSALERVDGAVGFSEVHLTGGEPTLHPRLPVIIESLKKDGNEVKITSNGERFYAIADKLKESGLDKVVFSIFGTTPEELAAVQGGKYNNHKFGQLKLDALKKSICAANEHEISASANIVMPDRSHAERVKRVIEEFGSTCKIRILNSLAEGTESYEAVYELLDELGAVPIKTNITAGASGMSVDYRLPDGKEIGFKQIRRSFLPDTCSSCALKDDGCDEGYYGVRMYVDDANNYKVGVCIQRMDITTDVDTFTRGSIPREILEHRNDEYARMVSNE